ncbi:MAG: hypothetical protein IK099_02385 [Clostridia bacterium]|nr:hypothetical protein [Clostridia bacterium]
MNQEKAETRSPFSAMSYQEQQDQWLAWRSRQLDYQPAGSGQAEEEKPRPSVQRPEGRGNYPAGRMRLPNMRIAAPTRHQELDEVISRHRNALRQAGAFRSAPID